MVVMEVSTKLIILLLFNDSYLYICSVMYYVKVLLIRFMFSL